MSESTIDQNSNILAFDASSESLHLCLKTGTDFYDYSAQTKSGQAQFLLPEIEKLLCEKKIKIRDIGLFVCAIGPGSFTGLRIGLSTAKGLASGNGCPFIGVNTLDAWESSCGTQEGCTLAVIDARKNRFYGAFYKHGKRNSSYLDETAQSFLSLAPQSEMIRVTGPHCNQFLRELNYNQRFEVASNPDHNPARAMLLLGWTEFSRRGGDPETIGPFYIRKSDAESASQTEGSQ